MKNAQNILSPGGLDAVRARIAQLETRTDAEVVCAVATESGRYDRAESLCGLTSALAALLTAEKMLAMNTWDRSGGLPLGAQALTVVLGFVAGSVLASYWHGLRRLFAGGREIDAEVRRSVDQVFAQRGLGETRRRGGLLIYLSLFEHRVEIRCDRALAGKLPAPTLAAVRDAVLARSQNRGSRGRIVGWARAGGGRVGRGHAGERPSRRAIAGHRPDLSPPPRVSGRRGDVPSPGPP